MRPAASCVLTSSMAHRLQATRLRCWQSSTHAPRPRGSTRRTAKQLLLRLRERAIKAELTTQPERAKELNTQLTQIREAMRSLDRAAVPD